MSFHTPAEEIDFLNKVQQPRHVHEAKERCGNGDNTLVVLRETNCRMHNPKTNRIKKLVSKIIDPRRRSRGPKLARDITERGGQQKHSS